MVFKKITALATVAIMTLGLIAPITKASLAFNDSRSLQLDSGVLTLYMGQEGSSFYLDDVNISGKPLSCEIKAGDTLHLRNNCNNVSFQYAGSSPEIKIYVQLDNDQGTWTYNTSSKTFTDARRGTSNVTNPSPYYPPSQNDSLSLSTNGSSFGIRQGINLNLNLYSSSSTYRDHYLRFKIYKQSGYSYTPAYSSDYRIENHDYRWYGVRGNDSRTLYQYISFNTPGTYKIQVEDDTTRRTAYTIVHISNTNNQNNQTTAFLLEANRASVGAYQDIDTTTTARDSYGNITRNYVGTVRYVVEKRSDNGAFWYGASHSDYSLSHESRYISASDNGSIRITNHLRFFTPGHYRLRVYDASNSSIEGTQEIYVGHSNNSSDTHRFDISTNRRDLPVRQYAHLTVRAIDRYNSTNTNASNTIKFEIYRRENSYKSWQNITSSYRLYTINPTTYTFKYSDRGTVTLRDAISFNEQGYEYLVKVIDYHNSSIYGETKFEVKNRNTPPITNTIRRYVGFTSPQVPEQYEPIGVTINAKNDNNTTTSHTNRVNFSLERKLLPTSNVWTKTGVATSCKLNTRSYTFSHSDKGQVALNNIMRCNKKGFYRLKITDHYNNNIIGYIYFTIVDTRDFAYYVHGFTDSQRREIQEEYRTFMSQVNNWEAQYPRLSHNKRRDNAWKNYYNVLNKITYDKTGRVNNYAGYEKARQKFFASLHQLQ